MNLVSLLILPAIIELQDNDSARYTIAGLATLVLIAAVAFSKRKATAMGEEGGIPATSKQGPAPGSDAPTDVGAAAAQDGGAASGGDGAAVAAGGEPSVDQALDEIAKGVAVQDPKVVLMSAYDAVIADVAVKDKELASNLRRKRGGVGRRR